MDVGMMMIFASYGWDDCPDGQVWEEEIKLARIAADAGFDCLWSAEHHFNDYSFVPDNINLMSYLAAICPDIDVGTAAVILPWHDPLRATGTPLAVSRAWFSPWSQPFRCHDFCKQKTSPP